MNGQAIPAIGSRLLRRAPRRAPNLWDQPLVITVAVLLALGLVMVTSASITTADRAFGEPFYYLRAPIAVSRRRVCWPPCRCCAYRWKYGKS